MTDYIRLNSYHDSGLTLVKKVDWLSNKDRSVIYSGQIISNNKKPIVTLNSKTANPSDYMHGTSFNIISGRFKDLLLQLPDRENLQFIECETNYTKKEKFYVLNILNTIDCFDWNRSEYTKEPTFINPDKFYPDRITRIELLHERIANRNIFRVEDYRTAIFISRHLEKIILEARLKVTLVRTKDMRQSVDSDPNDPRLAKWGHENL